MDEYIEFLYVTGQLDIFLNDKVDDEKEEDEEEEDYPKTRKRIR